MGISEWLPSSKRVGGEYFVTKPRDNSYHRLTVLATTITDVTFKSYWESPQGQKITIVLPPHPRPLQYELLTGAIDTLSRFTLDDFAIYYHQLSPTAVKHGLPDLCAGLIGLRAKFY